MEKEAARARRRRGWPKVARVEYWNALPEAISVRCPPFVLLSCLLFAPSLPPSFSLLVLVFSIAFRSTGLRLLFVPRLSHSFFPSTQLSTFLYSLSLCLPPQIFAQSRSSSDSFRLFAKLYGPFLKNSSGHDCQPVDEDANQRSRIIFTSLLISSSPSNLIPRNADRKRVIRIPFLSLQTHPPSSFSPPSFPRGFQLTNDERARAPCYKHRLNESSSYTPHSLHSPRGLERDRIGSLFSSRC